MSKQTTTEQIETERIETEWFDRRVTATKAVAALIPNSDATDDGGGPYLHLGIVDERDHIAYVLPEKEDGGWWQYQDNDGSGYTMRARLTVDADAAEVAAWVRLQIARTVTNIVCSRCGRGEYKPVGGECEKGRYICTSDGGCNHVVTWSYIESRLDPGENLMTAPDGVLTVEIAPTA